MKYLRFAFRIFIALSVAAAVFLIGAFLPLFVHWLLHGDPGMPGGAALAFWGFLLGAPGALVAGFYSFVKLDPSKELPK